MLKALKNIAILILFSALGFYFILVILGGGFGKNHLATSIPQNLNFAHRGCCMEAPRNSMDAFQKAQSKGLGIETDVRITKDNILVLFHDDTTKHKLGLKGSISDWTFDELSKQKFNYPSDSSEHNIVSLQKLKGTFPETILYLDIKTPSKSVADILTNKLSTDYDMNLIADANILFLSYLKYKNPKFRTVWEGFDAGKEWMYWLIPKNFKPDYLASFKKNVNAAHISWLEKNQLISQKIVYGHTSIDSALVSKIPYNIIECN